MKKKLIKILSLLLGLCMLSTGCAKQDEEPADDGILTVYASVYPIYAVARAICENVPDLSLHCLIQPQDGCFRDYTLSDWDATLISGADLVFIGGRGLESFESALSSMGETGPAIGTIMYNMELDETGPADVDADSSHWSGGNPQIYMSADGVEQIAESISAQMAVLDPDNSELYQSNLKSVQEQCDALKQEIETQAAAVTGKSVIVMNEACVYTAKDLGLDIALCIDRDSGEAFYDTELEECIEKMNAAGTKVCLIEKQAPARFVASLRDAGFTVLLIDVLTTGRETETLTDMLDRLRGNVQTVAGGMH